MQVLESREQYCADFSHYDDGCMGGANWYGYVSNDPINRVDPNGLEGVLYVYTEDISGPGTTWEYTFYEGAIAEFAKDGPFDSNYPVEFWSVGNRTQFSNVINDFYDRHGIIDYLVVYSHMFTEGLILSDYIKGRERFFLSSDLKSIEAEICEVKLAGCDAGREDKAATNIAESFANHFIAPVTAATSGTWFVGNQNGIGPFDRIALTLEPNGGEWKVFLPVKDDDNIEQMCEDSNEK